MATRIWGLGDSMAIKYWMHTQHNLLCVFVQVSFRLGNGRKSRWLTTIPDAPTLSSEPKKLYKPERSSAPDSHAAFFRLRFLYVCEKSRYVGSGRIQDPKGEYVRPVSGGFLSSRHPNECPKKAARGKWKCLDIKPS